MGRTFATYRAGVEGKSMLASKARARREPFLVVLMLMMLAIGAIAYTSPAPQGVRVAERTKTVYSKGGTEIDYGNSSDGYIMVKYKATSKKLKVRITKGDDWYDYDLNGNGEFEVYPLQMGNGKYKVQLFQQVKGTSYSTLQSKTIDVKLSDKNICFLYPNQLAMYDADSDTVKKSFELCEGLTTDGQKFEAIYAFCSSSANISYDYIGAMTNKSKSGYLPVVDEVLKSKIGTCFDYSAVMACMLRVQGIPTQLVVGYADKNKHAWNKVYLNGEWMRYDATLVASGGKAKVYTEDKRY